MKRRAFSLLIVITLLSVVCVTSVFAPVAAAEGVTSSFAGVAYTEFESFASQFADRTVGTEFELAAANWLAQRLSAMGLVGKDGGQAANMIVPFDFTYQQADGYYSTVEVKHSSSNVVAYLRSTAANAPLLVLAAPYSNELTYTIEGSAVGVEDAAYAASSVGCLLAVAARLTSSTRMALPYDVAFAFMGAEYFNMAGTSSFLQTNVQPLLGAVYLSQVGVGDDLNVYYDEVKRTHAAYVDDIIGRYGMAIQGRPFDPGYSVQVYGGDLPYAHVGIAGGNYLFMQAGVPSVHLFGYHWQGAASCESTTHADIVYTTDDTYAKFVQLYGREAISNRLDLCADLVSIVAMNGADTQAAFAKAQTDAGYQGLVSDAAYYALRWSVVGLAVVLAVVVAVLLVRRSRAAGTPDFSVNSEFINGRQEARDDVFGESAPIEGESGSVDEGADNEENKGNTPPDTNDIFGEF